MGSTLMKRILLSLDNGIILLVVILILSESVLGDLGKEVADYLFHFIAWPLLLFRDVFRLSDPLSSPSLVATIVFDILIIASATYAALNKSAAGWIRIGIPSACLILFLVAYSATGANLSVAKREKTFPGDSYSIFNGSQRLTLFSLDPSPVEGEKSKETFHGYKVLGKVLIADPGLQTDVKKSLYRAINYGSMPAACFNPRHGLRAEMNGKSVDLVICFECSCLILYAGKEKGVAVISSIRAEGLYNRIMRDAGVVINE